MSSITQTLSLEDKMTPTLSKIEKQAIEQIHTFEQYAKSVDNLKNSLEAVEKINPNIVKSQVYSDAAQALENMEHKLEDVANGEDEFVDRTKRAEASLTSFIARVASFAAIVKGVSYLVKLSDEYSQINARLGLIVNSEEELAQLNDKIYLSAQRSRVSYESLANSVSKLGNQAGKAFNNNTDQILAFSELLNKTFITAGLDDMAISSTMYNLTQSLSSGRLMGQDYRILKQNAPQIISYLEKFYDVQRAQLDDMVSKRTSFSTRY